MADYRLTANESVIRTADGAVIPNDATNTDWIAYQAWVDAGGVPDPYQVPIGTSQYDWGPTFHKVIGEY